MVISNRDPRKLDFIRVVFQAFPCPDVKARVLEVDHIRQDLNVLAALMCPDLDIVQDLTALLPSNARIQIYHFPFYDSLVLLIESVFVDIQLAIDRYDLIGVDQLVAKFVMAPARPLFLVDLFLDLLVRLKRLVPADGSDLLIVERIGEHIIIDDLYRRSDLVLGESLGLQVNNIVK